jgi:hypothetical protein
VLHVAVRHLVDDRDRGRGGRGDEAGSEVGRRVAEVVGDRLDEQLAELPLRWSE